MPRPCHPYCSEKRDFMEVNPPRSEADFYSSYDPMVGVVTAIVLAIFFFVVTIKSIIRYTVRRWKMYKFYASLERDKEKGQDGLPTSVEVI